TGACTSNDACVSGFCGVFGTGSCCAAQCMAAVDSACNPIDCDPTSGACVYSATSDRCGTDSCSNASLTQSSCHSGVCSAGTPTWCPYHRACNAAGTACRTSCSANSDCVSGFYCNAGVCAGVQDTGACTSNDACTSGICGVSGTGHCCTGPTRC